jgi:hypothetical protein
VFNKDIKVPLQETELVGTSSSNTLTQQRRPVALGAALSMLHWARHAASPDTAAMVIKTDQYNQ